MSFVGGRDYRTRSCGPEAGRMIMSVPSLSRLSHGFVQPRGEAIKFDPQPALSMPQGLHPEPARTSQATCLRPHLGRCDESGRLYEGIRSGRREVRQDSGANVSYAAEEMQHSTENHRSRASSVIAYDNKEKAQAFYLACPTSKPERSATNTRRSRSSSSRV